MEYKIIPASEADWLKFKKIRLEALQLEGKAFGASYEKQKQEPDDRWITGLQRTEKLLFFIEHEGEYIGMAGAKKIKKNVWMLIAVYLQKEYRGKGIAQVLVAHVEKDLKERGATQIDLMVNKEQLPAVTFYQKLGYKIIREESQQKMGDGNVYDEWYMSKVLT